MRWIAQNEKCLTAAEIAAQFKQVTGNDLHPTNVGNAAKKLGLDYIEVDDPDALDPAWGATRKLYAELDVPEIFRLLQELVDRRSQFEGENQRGNDEIEQRARG